MPKFVGFVRRITIEMNEIKELINKLGNVCEDRMPERKYSKTSKYPYKLMLFINSLNLRMRECGESSMFLLEKGNILSALVIIRAMMENTALLYDAYKLVKAIVEEKKINETTDSKLMQLLYATQYPKADCDSSDLDYRATRIGELVSQVNEDFPNWKKYYGALCEFVHPNSDGVTQSYSEIIGNKEVLFYPKLTTEHLLYPAFITTLKLALIIYIEKTGYIIEKIPAFTKASEDYIKICNQVS